MQLQKEKVLSFRMEMLTPNIVYQENITSYQPTYTEKVYFGVTEKFKSLGKRDRTIEIVLEDCLYKRLEILKSSLRFNKFTNLLAIMLHVLSSKTTLN